MNVFRSKNYPTKDKDFFYWRYQFAQKYYLPIFSAFAFLLLAVLLVKRDWMVYMIPIPFVVLLITNYLGQMQMQKTWVEIGFTDTHFYLLNFHDLLKAKEPLYYPLEAANPKKVGREHLQINYAHYTLKIKLSDWESPQDLYYRFFGL